MSVNDLTVLYYSADCIPNTFKEKVIKQLYESIDGLPIIEYHQPKDIQRSHLQIYKNALSLAREAKTKYVAFAEDDILYTKDHFCHRPEPGRFFYNKSVWSIYTWMDTPLFSWKDRRNLYALICERDLFIEAMEERFVKYTDEKQKELGEDWFVKYWAEPGKYEHHLGVRHRDTHIFFSEPPLIAFSHETALSFRGLGVRKKLGHLRSYEIPFWGKASDIMKLYG